MLTIKNIKMINYILNFNLDFYIVPMALSQSWLVHPPTEKASSRHSGFRLSLHDIATVGVIYLTVIANVPLIHILFNKDSDCKTY